MDPARHAELTEALRRAEGRAVALVSDLAAARAERDRAGAERDALAAEREALAAERRRLLAERDRLVAEVLELRRDAPEARVEEGLRVAAVDGVQRWDTAGRAWVAVVADERLAPGTILRGTARRNQLGVGTEGRRVVLGPGLFVVADRVRPVPRLDGGPVAAARERDPARDPGPRAREPSAPEPLRLPRLRQLSDLFAVR